jgi:hypothetical protein
MKFGAVTAACIALLFIAYGTLTQVGLPYSIYFKLSPWLGHLSIYKYALIEHLVVFAIFGALVSFAYPDRTISVCCIIVFTATVLEFLQTLTPDRHGTIVDACQKIAGGLLGAFSCRAIIWRLRHHGRIPSRN